MAKDSVWGAILAVLIAILLFFLIAWIFQVSYNYVLPRMSRGNRIPTINFWTAFLFLLVVGILGGFFLGTSIVEKLDMSVYNLMGKNKNAAADAVKVATAAVPQPSF